uniref:Fido domain-containing protein n=1 Tax=Steinernema glaseri TaxID=37863 RepID=A0A1I8AGL2_9BILA
CLLHALHPGLPAVVDGLELLAQLSHLFAQLRHALGLAGHRLQVAAVDPHGIARLATYLAVVALAGQQGDLLAGFEVADDPVPVGRAAAHVGAEAVADPAFIAAAFLGVGRATQDDQAAEQAGDK